MSLDDGLTIQKEILNWDRPPFKLSRSAGDFLYGKNSATNPQRVSSFYSTPSSIGMRPSISSLKDFDGSDYVDLCPQNSAPIYSFLHKLLPRHFIYHYEQDRVVAYLLQNRNRGISLIHNPHSLDNPIWRGSSASVSNISRILISLISVVLLVAPMFALTYIQLTGFLLMAAALFSMFFAVVFAICSRARNHEVFGVTAAYAAVLMVFVGNAIQGSYEGNGGG